MTRKLRMGLAVAVGMGCLTSSAPGDTRADEKLAALLDQVTQALFMEDGGVFGLGRVTFIHGHGDLLVRRRKPGDDPRHASTPFDRADAAGRPYGLAFLRIAHRPGQFKPSALKVPIPRPQDEKLPQFVWLGSGGEPEWSPGRLPKDHPLLRAELEKLALKTLPDTQAGKEARGRAAGRFVLLRPVRASKPSCVGCHAGSKRGDTLGVMLYAIGGQTVNPQAGTPAK